MRFSSEIMILVVFVVKLSYQQFNYELKFVIIQLTIFHLLIIAQQIFQISIHKSSIDFNQVNYKKLGLMSQMVQHHSVAMFKNLEIKQTLLWVLLITFNWSLHQHHVVYNHHVMFNQWLLLMMRLVMLYKN